MESIPYWQVLGSLLFLCTRSRPEVATAVSMLRKFQEALLLVHSKAMQSVLR